MVSFGFVMGNVVLCPSGASMVKEMVPIKVINGCLLFLLNNENTCYLLFCCGVLICQRIYFALQSNMVDVLVQIIWSAIEVRTIKFLYLLHLGCIEEGILMPPPTL